MKRSLALLATVLLGASTVSVAHTHLKESTPAQGSVLKAPPANIVLKFSAAARVTALTLQKAGGSEQKLTPLPTEPTAEVSVPTGTLTTGNYVVNWRVVSADGHIMSGKLNFTVDPAAAPSAGKTSEHDQHKH